MKTTVVIAVSSGIAAYKIKNLVKRLREQDLDVEIIMTEHATRMVPPSEFEEVSGKPVHTQLFPGDFHYQDILKNRLVDHIALADKASVFVVAPATANTIAKLAHGLADNFLTTTALAVTAPIIICPSMNVHMWHNPATQANLAILKQRGSIIIEPEAGPLACGYEGKGRLANTNTIQKEIVKQLKNSSLLQGKHVLVTTGGTVEPIDDVRTLTNKSTGKMGVAIAEAAFLHGANVTLLRAEHSVEPRYLMHTETFTTAETLLKKLKRHIKNTDIFFHVAAVSDFSIEKNTGKLSSSKTHSLHLQPQIKILDQIKKMNPHIFLVAFKAEHRLSDKELIQKAENRLKESHADVVVANDVSLPDRGFAADTNEVWVITKKKPPHKIQLASKNEIAAQLFDYLFS